MFIALFASLIFSTSLKALVCSDFGFLHEESLDRLLNFGRSVQTHLDTQERRKTSSFENSINTPYMETRILGPDSSEEALITTGLNPCVALIITVSTSMGEAHCMAHIAPQFANEQPRRHKEVVVEPLVQECQDKLREQYGEFRTLRANLHGKDPFENHERDNMSIHAQNLQSIHEYLSNEGIASINIVTNDQSDYRTLKFYKDSSYEILSDRDEKSGTGGELLASGSFLSAE